MTVAFVSAVQQRRQVVTKKPEAGTQAMMSAVSIAQTRKGSKGEVEHDEKTPKVRWRGTLESRSCDLFCTFMQMLICIAGISRGDISSAIC